MAGLFHLGFALTRIGLTIPAVAAVVIFSAFLMLAVVPC
jgi:hypothetical protein